MRIAGLERIEEGRRLDLVGVTLVSKVEDLLTIIEGDQPGALAAIRILA